MSRIGMPLTSSAPFHVPSSSLPIAALFGTVAIRASPVRASVNGIAWPAWLTLPEIDVPSSDSFPSNVAGSGPPLTTNFTARPSVATVDSGRPFTPCSGWLNVPAISPLLFFARSISTLISMFGTLSVPSQCPDGSAAFCALSDDAGARNSDATMSDRVSEPMSVLLFSILSSLEILVRDVSRRAKEHGRRQRRARDQSQPWQLPAPEVGLAGHDVKDAVRRQLRHCQRSDREHNRHSARQQKR